MIAAVVVDGVSLGSEVELECFAGLHARVFEWER